MAGGIQTGLQGQAFATMAMRKQTLVSLPSLIVLKSCLRLILVCEHEYKQVKTYQLHLHIHSQIMDQQVTLNWINRGYMAKIWMKQTYPTGDISKVRIEISHAILE